jgi:hypothetical protein
MDEAYPVESGLSRCSMLSDRIGAVARTDLLGLATKHEPTGYWDIIKRDNPYKRARRHTYYI